MRHTYLATVLLALCFGSAAMAQTRPARVLEAPEARLPESARPARSYPRLALPSRSNPEITSADVPRLTLPPLDLIRVRRERDLRRNRLPDSDAALDDPTRIPRTPRAQEIGINRDVQVTERDGRWFSVGAGRSWIIEITSTAAYETRLHFKDFQLPPGARLFVASPTGDGEPTYFEGKGPFGTGEFWSPIVNGDTIHLELLDNTNNALEKSGTLPFRVISVGHVYEADAGGFGSSAACELDFACYPDYATTGKSVAMITFSDPQYIYVCSAALLNNLSGDFSPLLLTAHHCISSDALANTVSVNWRFQSAFCNAPFNDSGYTSSYATLLATTYDTTDASLLQVLGSVPNTSTWAAWTTVDPEVGSSVTGIHHPHADPKKISFGKHVDDVNPNRHYVMWDSGIMEPGSSGSPLFNANNQVVGQLYGGASTCSVAGPDVYGKLRLSEPQLTGPNGWNYLEKGIPDDPYAPNQTRETAATISIPGTYNNLVLKRLADDWFRVTVGAGQGVGVSLSYDTTRGYIVRELYNSNGVVPQSPSASMATYTNSTTVSEDVYIHVNLNDGVRLGYSLTLSAPPVPAVTTSPVSSSTCPAAFGMQGIAGAVDAGDWPTTSWFEWGTDSSLSSPTRAAPVSQIPYYGRVFTDLRELSPLTHYYFRIVASTAAGVARGLILDFTTGPFPTPDSPFPANGSHLNTFPSQIGVSAGGKAFDVYLGVDSDPPLFMSGPPWTGAEYGPASLTSFLMSWTSFAAGTHYYWRVVAHYEGLSASSSTFDFFTPDFAKATPSALTFSPLLVGTSGQILLQIQPNTYFGGSLSYAASGDDFSFAVPQFSTCYAGCTIPVAFHPTTAGPKFGVLSITSSVYKGITFIGFTGTGFDMSLTRPSRPQRPGVVSAGQPQQMAFRLDTINVPGEVSLSCEVIPALANCEVSSRSVSGSGTHDLSVTLHTSRRGPQKLRGRSEDPDTVDLGTPPGSYTVRVTAAFAGATRTIDFPLQVR
jgi:hypothetical protein